jgi:hypothetical protein
LCVVNMTDDAQSLAEQCGTSVHATEALLCNFQEQKIKQRAAQSWSEIKIIRIIQKMMRIIVFVLLNVLTWLDKAIPPVDHKLEASLAPMDTCQSSLSA